jgi:cytochrome c-type biogenesis protein CcmF
VAKLNNDFALLIFPIVVLLADAYTLRALKQEDSKRILRRSLYFVLAVSVVVASYVGLAYAFVTDNFSFAAVFLSSSSSLPLRYKIAASYADVSGSYLLMLAVVGLVMLTYRLGVGFGTSSKSFELRRRTFLFADFVYVMLVTLVLPYDPFARSPIVPPEGIGLNPLLKSFWMIIHPPIVYMGYAFVFVPVVVVLAALSLREQVDFMHIRTYMELSWLLLTVGILTGGIWAYEVIGWGGYWSWDPVEVASLMPWLAITAYFHSFPSAGTNRSLRMEFMVFISFVLVLLAIFITRSGLVQSVHAFTSSIVGAGMMVVLAIIVATFFYVKRKIALPLVNLEIDWKSVRSISMALAFISLIALMLVSFVGDVVPLFAAIVAGVQISIGSMYYVNLCYPLALAFIAGLVGCDFPMEISVRKYSLLIMFAAIIGSVFVVLKFPTPNALANAGLPLVLIALVGVFASFVQSVLERSAMTGLRLVHLGATLILLGVIISSTLVVYRTNVQVNTGQPIQLQLDGSTVSIQFENPSLESSSDVYYRGQIVPEMSGRVVGVRITSGMQAWSSELSYGVYPVYGLFYSPAIVTTPFSDLFIIALPWSYLTNGTLGPVSSNQSSPTTLLMSVRVVPLAGLIWVGASLMALGVIMRIVWRSDQNGVGRASSRTSSSVRQVTSGQC